VLSLRIPSRSVTQLRGNAWAYWLMYVTVHLKRFFMDGESHPRPLSHPCPLPALRTPEVESLGPRRSCIPDYLQPFVRCKRISGTICSARSSSRGPRHNCAEPTSPSPRLPVSIRLTTRRVLLPVFTPNPGFLCRTLLGETKRSKGFFPSSSPFWDDLSEGRLFVF
jgi:hypothetical protein